MNKKTKEKNQKATKTPAAPAVAEPPRPADALMCLRKICSKAPIVEAEHENLNAATQILVTALNKLLVFEAEEKKKA